MSDYFEIDFLAVETKKSGDAIPIRYQENGKQGIHVVDGGFADTGTAIIDHIRKYYGNPRTIDRVIVTHPDRDHASGLQSVLEAFDVRELWMVRPWLYSAELVPQFQNYTSPEALARRLKACYPFIAALEEIAHRRRIPIYEPFQGARIGESTVLAPSRERYLQLVVDSEKTPESVAETNALASLLEDLRRKAVTFLKALWGHEIFSTAETSAENEMSVVQYATLSGTKILLTGDAGRAALAEAADYAPSVGLTLPGIDRFQVPHHGSRRNVSTEILDRWLGPRLPQGSAPARFHAYISSAKADEDHPRKAVERGPCTTAAGKCMPLKGRPSRHMEALFPREAGAVQRLACIRKTRKKNKTPRSRLVNRLHTI